jgi:DNA-binding LacI/PurR family transcriptional regulator
VIGCNDEKQAAAFDPPLTTVHIRTHQLGRTAVKLVNQMMESPDADFDRHLVLPVYLVERASTRSLK